MIYTDERETGQLTTWDPCCYTMTDHDNRPKDRSQGQFGSHRPHGRQGVASDEKEDRKNDRGPRVQEISVKDEALELSVRSGTADQSRLSRGVL